MLASRSGEEIAASAARIALSSPVASPMPMSAVPASFMIALTSAKSRLTSPGMVMRSEIPFTPLRRTSSARWYASRTVRLSSAISKRRSLGMTMRVSTALRSSARPAVALFARWRPSNSNGRVTTPTVKAPMDRAISATTGAAPVPVPPPSPAVTKTMSASSRAALMTSPFSSAALRPTAGSAPAPRPRETSLPMSSLVSASDLTRDWPSVLIAMNSTPASPS